MRTTPTTVTWLEMLAPPAAAPLAPPEPGLELSVLERPQVAEYLPLYEGVGRDLCWTERLLMPAAALQAILDDARNEVSVLRDEAGPLGYFELERRRPQEVQLAYFGLFPRARGRRLGPWLLDRAIRRAWTERPGFAPPARVWVHTCTLDDPRALPLYQRAGFVPYDTTFEQVTLLDD